jgi:hypothetical protein
VDLSIFFVPRQHMDRKHRRTKNKLPNSLPKRKHTTSSHCDTTTHTHHNLNSSNKTQTTTSTMAVRLCLPKTRISVLANVFISLLIFATQCHCFVPPARTPSSPARTTPLYFFFASPFGKKNARGDDAIPYIIETIGSNPSDEIFKTIADTCINVFFKEQLNAKPQDNLP